jgi:serine/threonine-protein kinase HipA
MNRLRCTIEIFIDRQWQDCCTIEIINSNLGGAGAAIFAYDVSFAFSPQAPTSPVSLTFPVNLDHKRLPHWPAFLFDLIPQGKGRRYLLGELGLFDHAGADWPLLCAGAFNPIGRLRIKEAVEYYTRHLERQNPTLLNQGFALQTILQRSEDFFEHLQIHGMLAAGTSGVQGVAPKFLLAQGKDSLWYADGVLPDEKAQKHYLVKLARGSDPSDAKILRNEAAYMHVAQAMGLRVEDAPVWQADMLFIPRFDRVVNAGGVARRHQESAASLTGQIGFDARPTQNQVLAALRKHVSAPNLDTVEFLKRDVLNLALGNTDNHARNSAVQILENGQIRLSPLFDFAPMFLDKEGIARALRWRDEAGKEINNWADVLNTLPIPQAELKAIRQELKVFGEQVARLEALMAQHGVDDDIIKNRHYAIIAQAQQLRELS